jgi:hypothetical protein
MSAVPHWQRLANNKQENSVTTCEFDLAHERVICEICMDLEISKCQVQRSRPGSLRSVFVTIEDEAKYYALVFKCKELVPPVSPIGGWK